MRFFPSRLTWSLLDDAVGSLNILISLSDSRRLLCQSRRGAVFSALAEFILFYYLSYLSLIFSSAHKPQVWEGRLLWKAGETWRGFLCYSLQREEQVSGACTPHRVASGAHASPCTRQKSHPCMQAQSCKWKGLIIKRGHVTYNSYTLTNNILCMQ